MDSFSIYPVRTEQIKVSYSASVIRWEETKLEKVTTYDANSRITVGCYSADIILKTLVAQHGDAEASPFASRPKKTREIINSYYHPLPNSDFFKLKPLKIRMYKLKGYNIKAVLNAGVQYFEEFCWWDVSERVARMAPASLMTSPTCKTSNISVKTKIWHVEKITLKTE